MQYPLLEAPHAPAHPDVENVESGLLGLLGQRHRIRPPRVPTVDDDVPGLEELDQRADGLPGGFPRRHHDPDRTGRVELPDELFQRRRPSGTRFLGPADVLLVQVEPHGLVAVPDEALHPVGPPPAEPDHSELHAFSFAALPA